MREEFDEIRKIGIAASHSPISIQNFNVGQDPRPLSNTVQLTDIPQNVPFRGTTKFVGRTDELQKLHQVLQQQDRVAILAIAGMGGIGKTELAIQYAVMFLENYRGGICWLNAKEELVTQLLEFAQFHLNLPIPTEVGGKPLTLEKQLQWCLQHWKAEGSVLVILDDVARKANIQQVIHQLPKRFRILLTTRQKQLDASFFELPLDVLSPTTALELLRELVGWKRIQPEIEVAECICKGVGYLPLGIELVGRYLVEHPFLKVSELQQQLYLQNEALDQRQENYVMTAQRGVRAAFELSWSELDPNAQNVGKLLSLFAEDAIPWYLIEAATNTLSWLATNVAESKQALYKLHLIQPSGEDTFKIHPLIHEFLRSKLRESDQTEAIQQAFIAAIVEVAKNIPETATRHVIEQAQPAIAHISSVAQNLLIQVLDQDLASIFEGLARFYWNQGLYEIAKEWCEQGLENIRARLGNNHLDVATSLNNLAVLYQAQGRYGEAEPLYLQALEMGKRLLGNDHLRIATSLHNLAGLYMSTLHPWKFVQAIGLQIQSLRIKLKTIGWRHPSFRVGVLNLLSILLLGGMVSWTISSLLFRLIQTPSWTSLLRLVFLVVLWKVLLRWNLAERISAKTCYQLSKWKQKTQSRNKRRRG